MNWSDKLINWYLEHKRDLPWRNTQDPYQIWLSEVILQQTRVDQGLPYFQKFVKNYPSIKDLAEAPEDQVLRDWQGLGYYSRAKNLQKTAKFISEELNGQFPNTFNEILALKGIGEYTAAAISSFAFKIKEPAIDGNVLRVISRVFGIEEPIDKINTKKTIKSICNDLIPDDNPDLFNQAIMELGATVCKPKLAQCQSCPFNLECYAFKNNAVYQLPIKLNKTKVSDLLIDYFILFSKKGIFIRKRKDNSIWKGLYEFANLENFEPNLVPEKRIPLILSELNKGLKNKSEIIDFKLFKTKKHKLSHRAITANFWLIPVDDIKEKDNFGTFEVKYDDLDQFAFPQLIVNELTKIKEICQLTK